MDEEKYQKELFEFDKPKRFFPKLSDFFPKGDFERNVVLTLTLDRAVFIAIGIIMVMVVLYALGVEAGKNRAMESARPVPVAALQAVNPIVKQPAVIIPAHVIKQIQPVKSAAPAAKTQVIVKSPVARPMVAASVPVKPAPVQAAPDVNKPYTIVAVTFVNKDTAMQEMVKLRHQGYNPSLVQSDRYFQVCIGVYPDKMGPESQKDLKKIKRLYKDAYIRAR